MNDPVNFLIEYLYGELFSNHTIQDDMNFDTKGKYLNKYYVLYSASDILFDEISLTYNSLSYLSKTPEKGSLPKNTFENHPLFKNHTKHYLLMQISHILVFAIQQEVHLRIFLNVTIFAILQYIYKFLHL